MTGVLLLFYFEAGVPVPNCCLIFVVSCPLFLLLMSLDLSALLFLLGVSGVWWR